MKKLNNKGFTLVELLAVIVILIAIMAIAIPSINSAISRNKETQNAQRMKVLESAAMEYINDNVSSSDSVSIDLDDLLDEGYISSEEKKDADGKELEGYMKYNPQTKSISFEKKTTVSGSNSNPANTIRSLKVGDFVSYVSNSANYTVSSSATGYSSSKQINPRELKVWKIIRKTNSGYDAISYYVSSTDVCFNGKNGYINYVSVLKTIANKFINSTYANSARPYGFNGQVSVITDISKFSVRPPWKCSTEECNPVERLGGGDMLYHTDYGLTNSTIRKGLRVSTHAASDYWVASRKYIYVSNTNFKWSGRYISSDGSLSSIPLYMYKNNVYTNATSGNCKAFRPIVILKPTLKCRGTGSLSSPCNLVTS